MVHNFSWKINLLKQIGPSTNESWILYRNHTSMKFCLTIHSWFILIRDISTMKFSYSFSICWVSSHLQSPADSSRQTSPSISLRPVGMSITFSLLETRRDEHLLWVRRSHNITHTFVVWVRRSHNITHTFIVEPGNSWWVNLHIDGWIHLVPQHFACSPLRSPYMERTCTSCTKTLLHIRRNGLGILS